MNTRLRHHLLRYHGATLGYRATYLHISERFLEQDIQKQKDPFKFNEMQISGPAFYSLADIEVDNKLWKDFKQ